MKNEKPCILVAPLDWGLGHATRCITLIRILLDLKCEVLIASEGSQAALLKTEFPELEILALHGYRAKYAKSGAGLFWNMLMQLPGFVKSIKKEHKWLQHTITEQGIDAVFSDNRYGLHHPTVPCVFITHQLAIKSPLGKWNERLLQKRSYRYINHFSACWVPDFETGGLAGELSHSQKLPITPITYTEPLSRFKKSNDITEKKKHLLILLSGPEPQRTIFEELLLKQLDQYDGTVSFVRGLPSSDRIIPSTNRINFFNHLAAHDLNIEMQKAAFVISRSGFSTVMDLACLQKKSLLVPTPGQTEQEYLAAYLVQKKWAFCSTQQSFSLMQDLQKAINFSYLPFPNTNAETVRKLVTAFVSSLSASAKA